LITPEDILLTSTVPKIKLARYGLHSVGNGLVNYLIGSFWYLAPERLGQQKSTISYKSDIWNVGLVMLAMFLRKRLEDIWGHKQILNVIYSLVKQGMFKTFRFNRVFV
jgi:serine/threonine protein kinase